MATDHNDVRLFQSGPDRNRCPQVLVAVKVGIAADRVETAAVVERSATVTKRNGPGATTVEEIVEATAAEVSTRCETLYGCGSSDRRPWLK